MTKTSLQLIEALAEDNGSDLVEEVGSLVFQSALMSYLAINTEAGNNEFEKYVSAHAADDSFVDDLCLEFPDFEKILLSEIKAFHSELMAE